MDVVAKYYLCQMKNLFILIKVCFLFSSCSSSDNTILVTNSGEGQGSFYHIKYMSPNGDNYKLQIDSILLEIDSSLSIYKNYSLISQLNDQVVIKTDSFFNKVFRAAKKIYLETDGNFDCSIRPIVDAWGFYENSNDSFMIVDPLSIPSLLKDVGYDRITLANDTLSLPEGMSLDFNSIAQGFTVDVISVFLKEMGINNYLIELGGELLSQGKNADGNIWRIGVDKPSEQIDNNQRFQFILDLENRALATSGSYRKFYEIDGVKYSHTIDPFTGYPVQNRLLSATVIHKSCMLADAYATAFMVLGVKKSKEFALANTDLEIYLVYTDNSGNWKTYISPEMQKRIVN